MTIPTLRIDTSRSRAADSGVSPYDDAEALIERFGMHAGFEAAALAEHSRSLGNHVHFCRWRQVERLIVTLSDPAPVPTGCVH